MTDQELIQLLQEKSAGELTPAEIEAIRARWTQSPELRQALVEHLHLESQLTGALAPVRLDVDTILKRAASQRRTNAASLPHWTWLVGVCLLLALSIGLFVFVAAPNPPQPIAKTDPIAVPNATESPIDAPTLKRAEEMSAEAVVATANGEKPAAPVEMPAAEKAAPNPVAATINVAANEPWSAAFFRDVAPWAADSPKLTADYKAAGHDEFPDSEAKRWLAPVEGMPFNWSTDSVSQPVRRIARFHGLGKLRAPWPEDAVLRMTPFEVTDLTLYFWHGPTGVALRFYTRREPHLWAAFEISRENSSPKPTRWGLLTTDSGSYTRSTPGTLDIRQQGDQLVLARGGIGLLSVPFVGPPLEVYVEGQFRLRGLSMHRSVPFPARLANTHPVVESGLAATLPWAISVDSPASFVPNDDGSVTMTVDSREKTGTISLPFGWRLAALQSLHASGLFEVIVNVESADPGTGIFLGDRNGRPVHQVGFFRDATTKQITFGMLRPGDLRTEGNYNRDDFPPPYLSKAGWLKLTAGLGTLHLQTSGDGVHWGHVVENPGRDWPGAVGSMGFYGLHGAEARSIRVRQVQVRELNGITDLADPTWRGRVPTFRAEHLRDLATWNHRVLETQPDGVDTNVWFSTCAVVTLSQGPTKDLGVSLLRELVAVGMKSPLTFEQKRQLLDDACSLCDLFDDGAAKSIGVWYEELGWQLAREGDTDPLAKLRPAWLWSPIWTHSKMRYVWDRLHSHEIIHAVYRREWPAAYALSRSAGYWNLSPNPDVRPTERGEDLDRHARWARTLASEAVPQLDDGTAAIMPLALRHPLTPVLNKEAYNVRAELQSALAGQTYDDACRVVMSIASHDGPGLLPDVEDRELYVSMPTAIASARKAHPGFAETMKEKFEPLGMIRVKSAINRQDLAGLQAVTLQFMGTDASREAHAWLGDMALSVGQFDQAEQHFRNALMESSAARREALAPRLLLARAMGGQITAEQLPQTLDQLGPGAIDLNGTSVPKTDFEAVIRDLVSRPTMNGMLTETARPEQPAFPVATYKLEPRAHFDGHPGHNPGRGEFRFCDAFGRQLSVATDKDSIYVSNRFQVNAYSISNGQQRWAQGLGSEQGEAYGLAFTPMKPLLAGDRLFVRRLTKAGTDLACLNTSDGQIVWHLRPAHSVLSDPIVWNGRLFALVLVKLDEELVQVEAAWLDPATGNIATSRPLFRLREGTDRQLAAQLTISDRVAVCTVAGTTAGFDVQGEMRWLRRHTLMLKPVDERSEDFRVAMPIVRNGQVTVSLPGVREVCCLDLETGRTIWERPITNLRGIACATESYIIVDSAIGLLALDANSGESTWTYPADGRLEGVVFDGSTLVVSRRAVYTNHKSKPCLVWLDANSGAERAQTLLESAEREECQFGPLFAAGGKWWSFVGQNWKDAKRELVEIVGTAGRSPQSFRDETLGSWSPSLQDGQLADIEAILPGWFPVSNYRERLHLHPGDVRGEVHSVSCKVDVQHDAQWVSRYQFAAETKPQLRLRVGNQPGQKWKLTVLAANQVLLEQVIEDAGGQNGWHDLTVDLSRLAGQTGSLRIVQSSLKNGADALWKRAEIVVE